MNKNILPKFKCLRCGHEWIPRKIEPKKCPKCNSPYWNKPKWKGVKSGNEPHTVVVNVRNETCDIYIGRATRGYKGSEFANPFKIDKDGDRDEVIRKYRDYFYERLKELDFKKKVDSLRGKRLGCWCKPEHCHGDVIVEYLESKEKGR